MLKKYEEKIYVEDGKKRYTLKKEKLLVEAKIMLKLSCKMRRRHLNVENKNKIMCSLF